MQRQNRGIDTKSTKIIERCFMTDRCATSLVPRSNRSRSGKCRLPLSGYFTFSACSHTSGPCTKPKPRRVYVPFAFEISHRPLLRVVYSDASTAKDQVKPFWRKRRRAHSRCYRQLSLSCCIAYLISSHLTDNGPGPARLDLELASTLTIVQQCVSIRDLLR
jgi:hypothetical protein